MRSSFSSVQFTLLALFGLTATALLAICGMLMSSAWQQQATGQRRMEDSGITRHLFQARQNVRAERGAVTAPLVERGPTDPAPWHDIQSLRIGSRSALVEALDELSHVDINARDRWIADLRTTNATVESMRAKADDVLQKRLIGSNAELNDQWVPAVGALVDLMDTLTSRLSSDVRLIEPFFDPM